MKTTNPETVYKQRQSTFQVELDRLNQTLRNLTIARLVAFVVGIAISYFLFKTNIPAAVGMTIGFIAAFLILVKQHDKRTRRVEILEQLVLINEEEQAALLMQFSDFEDGTEFIEPSHSYSLDLDIFGSDSVFQYFNRTSTFSGKRTLANWFSQPMMELEAIKKRQEMLKELRDKIDFRQHMQAIGKLFVESPNDQHNIQTWLNQPNYFTNKIYTGLIISVSILSTLFIVFPVLEVLHYKYSILYFLIVVSISRFVAKKVNKQHDLLSGRVKLFMKFTDLMQLIEKENFERQALQLLHKQFFIEEKTASGNLGKLAKISSSLDNGKNLIGVIVNNLFLRDLKNVIKLEKWKLDYGNALVRWIETVAEFDALNSLANVDFNHPHFTYPELNDENIFTLTAAGHPLIAKEEAVCNDFEIKLGQIAIITGANMAGKSTFLRTAGINLVLAMMGAPVCAKRMDFTPIAIYTGMSTKDSLQNHSSYFHAELSRLKTMFERLETGERLFVLLDELLKGTNSTDQHDGAMAITQKLIGLPAVGMVATHDLPLAKLAEKHPDKIFNKCFEIAIADDQMQFDYKLKDGVSQNMNASFLMKRMGIT